MTAPAPTPTLPLARRAAQGGGPLVSAHAPGRLAPTLESQADYLGLAAEYGTHAGRRTCHLIRSGAPIPWLQGWGAGATDPEALADAIACYWGRRLRDETELRLARARGRIYCQCRDGMLDGEHSCGHCDGGEYDEVRCRECEAPLAASDIACTCGEADGWLCATCAADGGLHSTGCPTPPACACGHGAQVTHCPDCSAWRCAGCVADRECCREAARAGVA